MSGEPLSDLEIALLVRMHGGPGGVRRLFGSRYNFVETAKGPGWTEENGVITLDVRSDGTTGPEWVMRLEKLGYQLNADVKKLLRSPEYFIPTTGVQTIVRVLRRELFTGTLDALEKIRYFARTRMACSDATPEVACLVREKLVDMELEFMSFWSIVVVSKSHTMLSVSRSREKCGMVARTDDPQRLQGVDGYAFAYSPSKS